MENFTFEIQGANVETLLLTSNMYVFAYFNYTLANTKYDRLSKYRNNQQLYGPEIYDSSGKRTQLHNLKHAIRKSKNM